MANLDQTTWRRRGAGLIGRDPRAGDGVTLIAPQTMGGAVMLIDMDGREVHRWTMAREPGRHAVLLPNGNLGYNGKLAGTPDHYPAWMLWHGGAFTEATPDGQVVWEHVDPLHHHDAQWLPDGSLLYGAMEPPSPGVRRPPSSAARPRTARSGATWSSASIAPGSSSGSGAPGSIWTRPPSPCRRCSTAPTGRWSTAWRSPPRVWC